MTKVTEYKLSWEMPDPQWTDIWQHITDFSFIWDKIPWGRPTEKVVKNLDVILDQWRQLKYWEMTKTQPIRNVHISVRTYEPTDWMRYEPTEQSGGLILGTEDHP